MLTLSQVSQIYNSDIAEKYPKNILVEYLQCEILDSIFKEKESGQLSFMGGTAIRIVYNGNRFSEDLDFDNFGLSFSVFKKLLEKAARDMSAKGFKTEFRFVEKGAFHCFIKFPDILYNEKLSGYKQEKILVRIDTVKKKNNQKPNLYALNKFDIYRNIIVNSPDILLSQKLMAILGRKREKGRDFYDVSYLYGFTRPNFEYIKNELRMEEKKFAEKLLEKCDSLDFSKLAKDIEPFLEKPDQEQRVIGFRDFIIQKLKRKE
ncbi:nucleotidyl transferase AbiEii/AbiGii toxin family protein [Patescibacteria group bacterium]|nr:nucleotidyl transferase AbiEii/AbiGii toxin family protein [Patescibacteria group bacterium]MBU4579922.1 nucleotidyl transferase AbiEii/AbiGii toxin family protein [Patescibacteria group bacterium]